MASDSKDIKTFFKNKFEDRISILDTDIVLTYKCDVLKNYNEDWKFVGLIDPTCRDKYKNLNFTKNTYMIYNDKNWGGKNKSLKIIANRINFCGGLAKKLDMDHGSQYKYFFETYLY